jgi:tetratricopeptide (TPR) repeat protein
MHDLLRQHARLKADQAEPEAVQREALTRVFDYYLDAASRAANHMDTGFQPVEFDGTRPPLHGPPLDTFDDAMAWLDAEQHNLIAAIEYATENGWEDHAWQLPQALWACSQTRGLTVDWIDAHKLALTATRDHIDQHTRAATLRNLGLSYWQSGQYTEALVEFNQSLALYRRLEDRKREGHMLNIIGATYRQLRQYDEAIDHHLWAAAVSEEANDPWSVGHALDNLGNVYRLLGRYQEAIDHHLRALVLMRDVGSRRGESDLLNDTGETYCAAGRTSDALDCHRQALAIARQTYDRYQEARAYDGIAHALRDTEPQTARDQWRHALEIYTDLGVSEARERAIDV